MSTSSVRPRIARDTRWLLVVVVVSLASLSMLARIRFRGANQITGPIAPVLSQIAPRSPFDDMTASLESLVGRLRATGPLVAIGHRPSDGSPFVTGVRFRDGYAAALLTEDDEVTPGTWLRLDRATRLGVARVSPGAPVARADWTPSDPAAARFFAAVDASTGTIAARPVFISSLHPVTSPRWPAPVWLMAGAVNILPGCFLFTLDGFLAGMAIDVDGASALVPAALLLSEAERASADPRPAGNLGLEAQTISPAVSTALGTSDGVVVTWVNPRGPAATSLRVADVVKAVDGRPIATRAQWDPVVDRLTAQQTVDLSVWRSGSLVSVAVTAMIAEPPAAIDRPLGLTLRSVRGIGVRIESVASGSAADAASLLPGDVLTLVGTFHAPSTAQAREAFRTASPDRPILLGVTRGSAHFVTSLDRRWP